MRRLIALTMVALLALALALAVIGCGGGASQEPASTPPAGEMTPPAGTMTDSTMMADTSMSH